MLVTSYDSAAMARVSTNGRLCDGSMAHAGGDALLTICLWKAGYAHTDPGFSFFHPTVRMFDPGPEDSPGLLYAMTEALAGRCDPSCQVIMHHTASETSHMPHVTCQSHGVVNWTCPQNILQTAPYACV